MRHRLCGFRWDYDMFHPKKHSHRCKLEEGHYGGCECSCGEQLA